MSPSVDSSNYSVAYGYDTLCRRHQFRYASVSADGAASTCITLIANTTTVTAAFTIRWTLCSVDVYFNSRCGRCVLEYCSRILALGLRLRWWWYLDQWISIEEATYTVRKTMIQTAGVGGCVAGSIVTGGNLYNYSDGTFPDDYSLSGAGSNCSPRSSTQYCTAGSGCRYGSLLRTNDISGADRLLVNGVDTFR